MAYIDYIIDDDDRRAMAALEWGPSPQPGPIPKFKFKCPPNHLVYFVGSMNSPFKIGWTQQPMKARLKCIQNGSPVKLFVLATQNAPRAREGFYHRQFAEHRSQTIC